MSVSNGEVANAPTFNNAFGSKQDDNSFAGNQELDKPGAGGTITDLQQRVNNNTPTEYSEQAISNGGEVNSDDNRRMQTRKIRGNGGAVIASNTPFGNGDTWDDGIEIRLYGISDTEPVTFNNNDSNFGMILNGQAKLKKYSILVVRWDDTFKRWVEVFRSL
jgi:hypothetical protein